VLRCVGLCCVGCCYSGLVWSGLVPSYIAFGKLSGLARPSILAKASFTRGGNYVRYRYIFGRAFAVELYLQTTMRMSALQAKLGSDTGDKRRPVHCELALLVTRLYTYIYVHLPFGPLVLQYIASPHSPRFCSFSSFFLPWSSAFSALPKLQKSVEQLPMTLPCL
jgi:hypothetical protein